MYSGWQKETGTHGCHKRMGLLDEQRSVAQLNGLPVVVSDLPNFVGSVQKATQIFRHPTWLDHEVAKRTDQSTVRAADIGGYRRTRCEQGSTGGIEHGVVRPIGCPINITQLKQGQRGCTGCVGLLHQRFRGQGPPCQSRTPSRFILRNSKGLT